MQDRRSLVEPNHAKLSITRQCELLGLARTSYYYQASPESDENLDLMKLIDAEYTKTPFYGSRRIVAWLAEYKKLDVNRKRIQRLMRKMRLEVIYARPRLTQRDKQHTAFIRICSAAWSLTSLCKSPRANEW